MPALQVAIEAGLPARGGGIVCTSRSMDSVLHKRPKAQAAAGAGGAGGGWKGAVAAAQGGPGAASGGRSGGGGASLMLALKTAKATGKI